MNKVSPQMIAQFAAMVAGSYVDDGTHRMPEYVPENAVVSLPPDHKRQVKLEKLAKAERKRAMREAKRRKEEAE